MTQPATTSANHYPMTDEDRDAIAEAVSKLPPIPPDDLERLSVLLAAAAADKWNRAGAAS